MGADRAKRKRLGGSIDMAWENDVRLKIQGSKVVNRLIEFVNGNVVLEPAQVTAGLGLLRKVLPDLSQSENKTEVTHRYVARVPMVSTDLTEWQKQHADPLNNQTLQ